MSFITGNKLLWRMLILALFILSMLGPWAFDLINVPAEYPCDKPFIRLEGDYCGYPISGFQAFLMLTGGLFNIVAGWTQGDFFGRGRELIAILFGLIFFLPFFSALLAIWKKDSRQWQTIHLITWGLAYIPLLLYTFLLSQSREPFLHAWGLWMYIVLAIGVLIIESLIIRSEIASSRDLPSRPV